MSYFVCASSLLSRNIYVSILLAMNSNILASFTKINAFSEFAKYVKRVMYEVSTVLLGQ
jgi:hypothetical protein